MAPSVWISINGNYLEYRLQNNIIDTIDAGYSGAEGIREESSNDGGIVIVDDDLIIDQENPNTKL